MLFNSLLQFLPLLYTFYRGWNPIGRSRTHNPPILCGYRINKIWSISRMVANIVNIVNIFSTLSTILTTILSIILTKLLSRLWILCQHQVGHYTGGCQCTKGLSPLDNCIREICSFAPIFQGNNCFRAKYLENKFHF